MENLELKPNLAKAVIAVMKDVKGVEKGLTVGTGGSSYKGVGDKDVKIIIGRAMANYGLCILPIEVTPTLRVDRWEEPDPYKAGQIKQKQQVFTEVTTKYLLLHESGESVVLSGYGHGVDSQDKSAGKATTYSLKYALLYAFLVPTGDIDDSEYDHSDSIEVPKKVAPKATSTTKVTTNPTQKKWLNKGTVEYTNAVNKLKAKTVTMSQIISAYNLSTEVKAELEKL